jgi:class 3 adenylate cyclase/tetratricopeptide (TPR) repeat protein
VSATVTLLFTDIVGSTQLLDDMGDERFNELRRVHFRELRDAIVEFRGQEVKSLGDGLMAVFPSVVDACRCAMQMQRDVAGGELAIRIGLHVGEPITYEDDYFGMSVALARQLCERGQTGQILVSDLVRALAAGREGLAFSETEPVAMPGQDEALPAHELAWRRAAGRPWKAPLPSGLATNSPPFVGRDHERELLLAAWDRASGGHLELASVSGDPGMGKTRLVAEVAKAAFALGATVVHGRCDEEGIIAFLPLLDILRQLARAMPAELLADLASRSVELASVVPELHPYSPAREGGPGREGPARIQAQARAPRTSDERYVFFEAVAAVLRAAAEHAPLVMVIDDVHWADPPSLLLIRHVLRALLSHRVLVLFTWREGRVSPLTELLRGLPRFGESTTQVEVRLEGLDEAEVAGMLETWAGHAVSKALVSTVHRQTEGNPYFVEEFVRDLIESGVLAEENGKWVTRGTGPPRVPEGITEVIGRRLGHLSADAQLVLTIASVIGRQFALDTLGTLTDLAEDPLLDAVEEAVAAELIVEEPFPVGRFRFRHALIRETLYAELSVTRRVLLHRRIANVLEATYRSDLDTHLTELAYHFHDAAPLGDVAKAVEYCRRAGDQSMKGFAYEEAARLYEMALDTDRHSQASGGLDRSGLLLAMGTARARAGDQPGGRAALLEAASVARANGEAEQLALAALGLGQWVEFGTVDTERQKLLEEALEAIGQDDSALRALLLSRLAHLLSYAGDPSQVNELAAEAESVARRLGDPVVLSDALAARHDSLWEPDALPRRLAISDERLTLVESTGDREQQAMVRCHRLVDLLEHGQAAAAWQELDAHRDLAVALRQPFHLGFSAMFGATRAMFEGRFGEAERLAHESADLLEADPNVLHQFGAQLFFIRREQDGLTELEPFLRTQSGQADTWRSASGALRTALTVFLCDTGQYDEAASEFDRLAAHDFTDIARDAGWLTVHALLAEVCAELVDVRRAALLYDLIAPYAGRMLVVGLATASTGSIERQAGVLAMTFGRLDLAARHFDAALGRNREAGARPWAAHAQHNLATVLLRRRDPGDLELARRHLEEASETARELGMTALLRRIDAVGVPAA